MKKLFLFLLILFLVFPSLSFSSSQISNLFIPESALPTESEINPWALFYKNDQGKIDCRWKVLDFFKCPEGDFDLHLIVENPDPNAEIKVIEFIIGSGALLPFGTLCSFSYMKNGKWMMFYLPHTENRYVLYIGDPSGAHGGSWFVEHGQLKKY